jgi:hypothetical protein
MDFVHDQLATGRKIRVLTVVDIGAGCPVQQQREEVVATRDRTCAEIGYPKKIRPGIGVVSRDVDLWAYGHVGSPRIHSTVQCRHRHARLLEPGVVDIGQDDMGAGLGQCDRRLPSDAGGSSGDHGAATFKAEGAFDFLVHARPLKWWFARKVSASGRALRWVSPSPYEQIKIR